MDLVMKENNGKFILSNADLFDLASGLGNTWMNQSNSKFNTWKGIYEDYSWMINSVDSSRVLGAELLLWGGVTNDDNF